MRLEASPRGRASYRWSGPACVALLALGCSKDFTTEGDLLRARVLELEKQNQRLARRVTELDAELEAAADQPGSLPEDVRAAIPHVAEITLDRLSHVVDGDEDGRPDLLRVYVKTGDGRGRFVQLVGSLSLHAALLPAEAAAVTVARCSLGPLALRDAYRSGVTGTHYTIECPLELPRERTDRELVVQVVHRDAMTGRELTARRAIRLGR